MHTSNEWIKLYTYRILLWYTPRITTVQSTGVRDAKPTYNGVKTSRPRDRGQRVRRCRSVYTARRVRTGRLGRNLQEKCFIPPPSAGAHAGRSARIPSRPRSHPLVVSHPLRQVAPPPYSHRSHPFARSLSVTTAECI